jgi:hypothetical protein
MRRIHNPKPKYNESDRTPHHKWLIEKGAALPSRKMNDIILGLPIVEQKKKVLKTLFHDDMTVSDFFAHFRPLTLSMLRSSGVGKLTLRELAQATGLPEGWDKEIHPMSYGFLHRELYRPWPTIKGDVPNPKFR